MLTPLTKHISQEAQVDGVIFTIRPPRNWSLLFISGWLAFWLIAPFHLMLATYDKLLRHGQPDWFNLFWSLGWIAGIAFAAWSLLWSIGGRELINLSPSKLQLTKTLFNLAFRRRTSMNADIRNLRYSPAMQGSRSSRASDIRYEDKTVTVKFANGLPDAEAFALIDAMLTVYSFPRRDRALAYMEWNGR